MKLLLTRVVYRKKISKVLNKASFNYAAPKTYTHFYIFEYFIFGRYLVQNF
jgi:hypothetical protein